MQGNQMLPQRTGSVRQDWTGEIGGPVYETAPAGQGSPLPGLESGMGGYHGKAGFETFSHYRSIVDKKTWMDLPIRYQKYTGLKEKMMRMFLK